MSSVVFAFFLCWAPFHAQRLGYVYFKESQIFRTINEYLMYVSGITYYISSTINPILYNLMSTKYSQAFKRAFCGVSSSQHGEDTLEHHQRYRSNAGLGAHSAAPDLSQPQPWKWKFSNHKKSFKTTSVRNWKEADLQNSGHYRSGNATSENVNGDICQSDFKLSGRNSQHKVSLNVMTGYLDTQI